MKIDTESLNIPDYLSEETRILLEKFGKGSHKPGSGSAAAFSGMISAKLLLTVISLTLDNKRREKYQVNWPELTEIKDNIESIIFPKLCELFQDDCEAFNLVVNEREKRDETKDEIEKAIIQKKVDIYMVDAIAIPFEIGNICTELAKYAVQVFDLGWRAVRGDSGVALEKAIAAIGGSTFVITLNLNHTSTLTKFSANSRMELGRMEAVFKNLKKELDVRHNILKKELLEKVKLQKSIAKVRDNIIANRLTENDYIQDITRNIQITLWKNSNLSSKGTVFQKVNILSAKKVLKILGYNVAYSYNVGSEYQSNKYKEIAGVCDNENKLVAISSHYEEVIQRFTLAHELGHAIMHRENTLFRDLPLDGSEITKRDIRETQANKFAAFFLMPRKLVIEEFINRYNTPNITSTMYKIEMNISQHQMIKSRVISKHYASMILEEFNNSIASTFKVSIEAMAIRLEELKLIVQ